MEVSSPRHDQLLTQTPTPLLSPKERGGAESSKVVIMLGLSSGIIRTKDVPIAQNIPRDSGTPWKAPLSPPSGNCRALGAVC